MNNEVMCPECNKPLYDGTPMHGMRGMHYSCYEKKHPLHNVEVEELRKEMNETVARIDASFAQLKETIKRKGYK